MDWSKRVVKHKSLASPINSTYCETDKLWNTEIWLPINETNCETENYGFIVL